MKKLRSSSIAPVIGLLALLAGTGLHGANPSPAASSVKSRSDLMAAKRFDGGTSARDIIGREVKNMGGRQVGEIKDLLVDLESGKVTYALLSSGGILGVGETLYVVPFSRLTLPTENFDELVLDLPADKWSRAPAVRDDEIDGLASSNRGREIADFYAAVEDPDERKVKAHGMKNRSGVAMKNGSYSKGEFARVSAMVGRDVVNAGRKVGEVEDVVLNVRGKRAWLLLDPNDDYTGTDDKFLVRFNQLSAAQGNDEAYATTLTRQDFARATPRRDEVWSEEADYPYIWPGYGIAWWGLHDSDRTPMAQVTAAIKNDASLPQSARDATRLTSENDKIVITGKVRSEEVKDQVEQAVEEAASGWRIENRLTVAAAR